MGVSIEIFKVHTFFSMSTTPQAFFYCITLKRTLCYEKWYQFHFSTIICVGITTSVAFFLSTTVHGKSFRKWKDFSSLLLLGQWDRRFPLLWLTCSIFEPPALENILPPFSFYCTDEALSTGLLNFMQRWDCWFL